jgi:hypothetical protein
MLLKKMILIEAQRVISHFIRLDAKTQRSNQPKTSQLKTQDPSKSRGLTWRNYLARLRYIHTKAETAVSSRWVRHKPANRIMLNLAFIYQIDTHSLRRINNSVVEVPVSRLSRVLCNISGFEIEEALTENPLNQMKKND